MDVWNELQNINAKGHTFQCRFCAQCSWIRVDPLFPVNALFSEARVERKEGQKAQHCFSEMLGRQLECRPSIFVWHQPTSPPSLYPVYKNNMEEIRTKISSILKEAILPPSQKLRKTDKFMCIHRRYRLLLLRVWYSLKFSRPHPPRIKQWLSH